VSRDGLPHDGRLSTVERGPRLSITVDGVPTTAYEGETIAAVLLAGGAMRFRSSEVRDAPRGYYCGMGICFECLVRVDGAFNVRACMTPVRDGMAVERERAKSEDHT
jgi:predicted molibdopterin-dependent oxidoreductase YjgC